MVTVGKTSDVLLRDTWYKIEKVMRQPVTALGRRGYSTGRSAAVFMEKPVVQLNTYFKAHFLMVAVQLKIVLNHLGL